MQQPIHTVYGGAHLFKSGTCSKLGVLARKAFNDYAPDASRLAHLRYEGGVDTLLNALVADTSLFNAELSLAQTKRNELLSLVQLYKALGGGWQQ